MISRLQSSDLSYKKSLSILSFVIKHSIILKFLDNILRMQIFKSMALSLVIFARCYLIFLPATTTTHRHADIKRNADEASMNNGLFIRRFEPQLDLELVF